ncbi:MAG: DUF3847 domain-containing protein [Defluviitaleaceae bacterium]|nr:DUF3847 domain-containing protein [Defluviitaleaceae bacterium]
MSKTTQISNQKITKLDQQIAQLNNRKKQEIQKMKTRVGKARNHRLCKRHSLLESLLPDTINLTDEQYKAFLDKAVVNDYGRRVLAGIVAKGQA